ncbi:MAG: TatD family hydrolase [Firmicutes bacterium]|nr:TatD family hydrolase [Bacillota bacterium]MCL1953400.1 TatD family hydrolase [Bacillota bacterium]
MIDTHAHLQDDDFSQDRDNIISSFRDNGVQSVICIGTNEDSSNAAIAIANKYPKLLYPTVGLHPHYCVSGQDLSWLQSLASTANIVAIAEFGLDFHYDNYCLNAQVEAFEYQLQLAKSLNLPYAIHMRDATKETMDILYKYKVQNGVMHCFGGDVATAKQALDIGMMISFSGNVTFKNASNIQEAAKFVPLDRMLIETDCPYLSPVPNRGKRNDPTNLKYTAQFVADLRRVSLQAIDNATTNNASKLFGIAL